jgi:dTDP-glucose pyrophosphorylase/predicted transcriptional regulator
MEHKNYWDLLNFLFENAIVRTSEDIWRQSIISISSSIQEAISNLDKVAIRIVLVVNVDGKLEGTISDGDIRRSLLRGLDLKSPIASIVNRNPLVVSPEIGRETVRQLMVVNKIQQIPVVNEQSQVVGLHLWDEITTTPDRENLMVIMAGGMGSRLRPHTENCPKPMLPVSGKPILEHIIDRAKLEGFSQFILAIHYLGHMIEDYFEDGNKFHVRIDYLRESSPLGTAGALSLLKPQPNQPFVVTNGDVLTDIHYGELLDFHIRYNAAATMAVRVHEWQHPFGVVQTKGIDIIGFDEKPVHRSHINAGVYALEPEVLDFLEPELRCDMPTLFERLQKIARRTVAYPVHEPWLDVGRPDDLASASTKLSKNCS